MGKPNYGYKKYLKEQSKKKKQEEKRQRRLAKKNESEGRKADERHSE